MKDCICILSIKPHEIWINFLKKMYNKYNKKFDIYIIVDDNSKIYESPPEIKIIQLNDNIVKNSSFIIFFMYRHFADSPLFLDFVSILPWFMTVMKYIRLTRNGPLKELKYVIYCSCFKICTQCIMHSVSISLFVFRWLHSYDMDLLLQFPLCLSLV